MGYTWIITCFLFKLKVGLLLLFWPRSCGLAYLQFPLRGRSKDSRLPCTQNLRKYSSTRVGSAVWSPNFYDRARNYWKHARSDCPKSRLYLHSLSQRGQTAKVEKVHKKATVANFDSKKKNANYSLKQSSRPTWRSPRRSKGGPNR